MPGLDTKAILQGRRSRHSLGLILGSAAGIFCTLVMLGYLLLLALAGGGQDPVGGVVGFTVSLLAAIIPVTVLIPLILLLDRLEPEPGWVLFFAFVWGAGIAVLASLLLNTLGVQLLAAPLYGEDAGMLVGVAVIAPLVEESAKGLVLLLLLWRRRHEIDSFTDGVIYAGMVAVGFAFTENVLYFLGAFFEGDLIIVWVLRGLIAPFGHPLYTAMIGIGVAYAAMNRGALRLLAPVAGWCAAVLLHAMWNGAAFVYGLPGLALAYLVLFFVLMMIIALAVRDRRRQVAAISSYLPHYVPTGLVTPADITMLSSISGRRAAREWARANAGRRGMRAMKDYQLAATELALLHQRRDRGVARPGWEGRRDAFLALMHVAREAFLGRVHRPLSPGWAERPDDSGFLRRADFDQVISQAHRFPQDPRRPPGADPRRPPGQGR